MWIKPSSKRELLDLAGNTRRPVIDAMEISRATLRQFQGVGEFLVAWEHNPAVVPQFPTAILLPEPAQREFIAWAATFLEYYRPFTAYCRILDPSAFEVTLDNAVHPAFAVLQRPLVGLILGEVVGELEGRSDLKSIYPIACLSTFSYVAARSIAVSLEVPEIALVTQNWLRVLRLARQPRRRMSGPMLEDVWSSVFKLAHDAVHTQPMRGSRGSDQLNDAVQQLILNGDIDSRSWRRLTNGMVEFERIKDAMGGSREERVLGCERALENLRHFSPLEMVPRDFVAGYLVSRISPGTLDHIPLLRRYTSELPTATLWYGFCAGCDPSGEILNGGDGLGRRVLRDTATPHQALSRPECDIALAELEVLVDAGGSAVSFRQERSGYLRIEMLPGVSVHFRTSDADDERIGNQDSADLAMQLDELVWRMYELRRKLLPGSPAPEEQGRPVKRGRRKGY